MKKFYTSLREHVTNVINFEKKKNATVNKNKNRNRNKSRALRSILNGGQ